MDKSLRVDGMKANGCLKLLTNDDTFSGAEIVQVDRKAAPLPVSQAEGEGNRLL